MPVTSYYSLGGQLVGESSGAAGARLDYLSDALGSVTATVNQSAQVQNTYRYKPYGARLATTGVGADPAFQWVGSHGYRQTGKKFSEVYVRARHYSSQIARWTTRDLLLQLILEINADLLGAPDSRASDDTTLLHAGRDARIHSYLYVEASPNTFTDPSGLERRIGPVPSHKKCGPNSPPGTTGCNLDVKKGPGDWSLICNTRIDAPCTEIHEQGHRNDNKECCRRAVLCVKNKKGTPVLCEFTFAFRWAGRNQRWHECRNYPIGLRCRKKMFKDHHCNSSCATTRDCRDIRDSINNDENALRIFGCQDVDTSKVPPCPFNPDGSIIPDKKPAKKTG